MPNWNILIIINVIVEQDKILLIQETKEDDHTWFFPAGQVEGGEDIVAAAIRETQEEAGIVCRPQSLIDIQHISLTNSASPNGYETKFKFVIISKFAKGSLKTLKEADEHSYQAKWVPLDEVENLDLRNREEVHEVLAKFVDYQKIDNNRHSLSLSNLYKFIEF